MNDTANTGVAPEAAALPLPRVRMDRSRAFSAVHGDRGPNDRYAQVFFFQDGIPADAGGYFIFDHPDVKEKPGKEGDKLRALVAKKIERALKQQAKAPPPKARDEDEDEADVDRDEDDDDDEDGADPINLDAWLRGEQDVEWQEVTQEIARRYKRRFAHLHDAVDFLVTEEKIVPKAQVRQKWRKHVR